MPSRRSLRPLAESLETRQLLSSLSTHPSASVTGTDAQGDVWTLTLLGPGTLNVVDQQGMAFPATNGSDNGKPNVIPVGEKQDINTITVSGTFTSQSRLVGKVTFVPANSDGRVFFQQLSINSTGAYPQLNPALVHPRASTPQNGIAAVDMPNFWLGDTSGTAPTAKSNFHSTGTTQFFLAGGINAPEGINNLRFGGVDTTFTEPVTASLPAGGEPLDKTDQNNEFVINLGPPIIGGTSIIVNKVITDAGSSTTSVPFFQQSVTFAVNGRINLFQANEIDGNAGLGLVPTQFTPTPTQPQSRPPAGRSSLVSDVAETSRPGTSATSASAAMPPTSRPSAPVGSLRHSKPRYSDQRPHRQLLRRWRDPERLAARPRRHAQRLLRPRHGPGDDQFPSHRQPPGQPRRPRLDRHDRPDDQHGPSSAATWSTRRSSRATSRT